MRIFSALTVALLPLASAAVSKITRHGKYLYDDSGSRFYIKGVAYQPQGELAPTTQANDENGGFPEPSSFIDPLSSEANCTRDLPLLKQLGVNAVRVYSVNSSLDHDACMNMFNDAGIYVLLDISLPLNGSIDRASPAWTTNLLTEYVRTIDAFHKYENILSFNVGNEVITIPANTHAAPFVKAAARDVKAYLKSIGSNALVGYSATDGESGFRSAVAHYFTCGNATETIDLYGLNSYGWCGDSNLQTSSWSQIADEFKDLPVPSYMSEFGCIKSPPRLWTEVSALLATPMSDVFSGGVAFSYFSTSDGYGMTTISGNNVQTSDDFTRLAAEYNKTNGPNSPSQNDAKDSTITCPEENANLEASAQLPPTPNPDVCKCLDDRAFACVATQETANNPVRIGELTGVACNLLNEAKSSVGCSTIGGNGTTGEYGPLSMCAPATKLSWIFSAYFMLNPTQQDRCDFGGNATRNRLDGSPQTSADASIAADECLKNNKPTSTPTGSAQSGGGGAAADSSSSAAGGKGNGDKNSGAFHIASVPTLGGILLGVAGFAFGAMRVVV